MNKHLFLILIGLLVSCNESHLEYGNTELSAKFNVTKIETIEKNPTELNMDTIRIIGQLGLDLENKGINHKTFPIWINSFHPATKMDSVWKNMNYKKVEIIGLYKSGKTGHLGLYNGQLKEIYYIKTK